MGVDDNDKNSLREKRDVAERLVQEEFMRKLRSKYDCVFDEPVPDRLADPIARLREIKSS